MKHRKLSYVTAISANLALFAAFNLAFSNFSCVGSSGGSGTREEATADLPSSLPAEARAVLERAFANDPRAQTRIRIEGTDGTAFEI